MINFLDYIYFIIPKNNFLCRSLAYIIRVIVNIVYLFYPVKTKLNDVNNKTVIVSLTTYPGRVKTVWLTVSSLLNQTYNNIHIVLWLSSKQFPNQEADLPKKLLNLKCKGLDIQFVDEDYKSHKKYFYALKKYPLNDLVTVDDDVIYRNNLIETLVSESKKHKLCVICTTNNGIQTQSYKYWKKVECYCVECLDILPIGYGGVLYPSGIFEKSYVLNFDVFLSNCLYADDLWLNYNTRINLHNVVCTGMKTGLVTVLNTQKSALTNRNVHENQNDMQIDNISRWAKNNNAPDFYFGLK